MGQSPSTAASKHDNASTGTLHSTSIQSNRPMSFFKKISQRIQPSRRFSRQNRANTAATSTTQTATTRRNRPSERRTRGMNRQGFSILMNSGSSTTSSVRRATQEATLAAAAVTGPPALPNLIQYIHQIQDYNGSSRNSVMSSDSTGLFWELSNGRVHAGDTNPANLGVTENEQQTGGTSFLRHLRSAHDPENSNGNTSHTTVASSGVSTTSSRRMRILVIEYMQNSTQNLTPDNVSISNASIQQPPPRQPSTPTFGRRLLGLRRPRSAISTSSSTETVHSMPLSMHTTATGGHGVQQDGQWVVYVLNGQNALQMLSSTLADDNPSYEDLLWLTNIIGPAVPNTTTQAAIDEAVPVVAWSDDTKKEVKDEQCLVCLDEFDLKQPVRILKCRHVFHKECVDRWLCEAHNSCPVCRGVPV
ncbi:unnamed protein product [Rhizopus microsporus]